MNQQCIAGIGNIYAQEILYRAGIHPLRRSASLSGQEIRLLLQALRQTLRKAIRYHGTTILTYTHIGGKGRFQHFLAVYGRKSCPRHHALERIKVMGRGTSYCPSCQH